VVVAVAGCHRAASPADATHLLEDPHRIGDVLEHLMGVHDVEAAVVEGE
jgi:hypothetical protein